MNFPFEGQTLLVGEGDFSFSVAVVNFIPIEYRKYVISTSLETEDSILKHKTALVHIDKLKEQGVTVYLETDATQIHKNPLLKDIRFDRIIFNFPHSGGKSNHKKNRKLLSDFFCSAVQNLNENGHILMTLCKGQGGTPADRPMRAWHDSWQVVSMAANAGLILKEVWPFVATDFPEYACTGFRSQDKGFNTEGAITHVFHKAEIVNVPRGDNPVHEYVHNRINRKLFQEENHPIKQVYRKLENSLTKCFCLHQYDSKHPILDNYKMKDMAKVLSLSEPTGPYFGDKFYKITQPELCEIQKLEMTSLQEHLQNNLSNSLEALSNSNTDVKSENLTDDCVNIMTTSTPGEIIQSQQIHHLRLSMLEHVRCLCDEITHSKHEVNTQKEQASCNPLTLEANYKNHTMFENSSKMSVLESCEGQSCITTYADSIPCLHVMIGQVCKPCSIKPNTCPVNTEMLGIIQFENKTCDKENIISICQKVHSCFNECFSELEISLVMSEVLKPDSDQSSLVGILKLTAKDFENREQNTIGHIWLSKDKMEDIKPCLIFVADIASLTAKAFKLPHIELLYLENVDFSNIFLEGEDNSFEYRPISLFPVSFEHDMSFWENETKQFDEYIFFDVIRGVAKDSIISVELIDSYICETTGRKSRCYRLQFQSHDKALSYDTSWKLQSIIRLEVARILEIILR